MFLLSGVPSMECLIHQRKQLCVSATACLLLFIGGEEVRLNDHSCYFCLYNPGHIIKAQLLKSVFLSSILLIPYLTQNLVFQFGWLDLSSKPQGGGCSTSQGSDPTQPTNWESQEKSICLIFGTHLSSFPMCKHFLEQGPAAY